MTGAAPTRSQPESLVLGAPLLGRDELSNRVGELARSISADYQGKDLLLVCILKGAAVFVADLQRALEIPCEIEFMSVSSYGSSTESSGVVRIRQDLEAPIRGRDVLVVEDIIDTGLTLHQLLRNLAARGPASLEVCALIDNPARRAVSHAVRYVGFTIPDRFVVGYGLDHNEQYRQLPYLATLEQA